MNIGTCLTRKEAQTRLRSFWPGEILWDVPLSEMTTMRTGGIALAVIKPASPSEVACVVKGCNDAGIGWVCIGGGSNIVAGDEGFPGVIISLGEKMSAIRERQPEKNGRCCIEVEAGCKLAVLLKWCVDNGLSGLEFSAGIPGTLGGAVAMNAGAWGKEMKDVIESISWFDGEKIVKRTRAELQFAYRCWLIDQPALVLQVELGLDAGDPEQIRALCRRYVAERKGKQPVGASSGSFFKNPQNGVSAGELIEDAGLKGTRVGGAAVSEVHANFILNLDGATTNDILRLKRQVQERVSSSSGVRLEPEVHFLGVSGIER